MPINLKSKIWWGPPKNFSSAVEERKVSWLELFYDLVYVIAISKINHQLFEDITFNGLLDFLFMFSIIFWGWLNGSLHHDLHGSEGLRTRLMTLWQMMIVAALVITLESPPENQLFNITIALMVMQLYITYLWWSVGIYDKNHRKLNIPYTIFYLLSFAFMFLTLFLKAPFIKIVFFIALVFNYLPSFIIFLIAKERSSEFRLSSSMSERLGLFTIIIFGEVVLGVISGINELHELSFLIWCSFGLAVSIVFSLWWLFFTLISDRLYKKGILTSSFIQFFFLPTLMALSIIGVGFNLLFESDAIHGLSSNWLKFYFGMALSIFILGINILLFFIEYPVKYQGIKKWIQLVLLIGILLFIVLSCRIFQLSLIFYFLTILIVLLSMILVLNLIWYRMVYRDKKGGENY